MRSGPTREELLDVLKKFTAGELAIELFVNEFDELGKLGVSGTLRDRERELFGEFWRNCVDAYTPHYKRPTTVASRLKGLVQEFKGEPQVGADAVRAKAAELQCVMSSS
jgi:hypothetical protein